MVFILWLKYKNKKYILYKINGTNAYNFRCLVENLETIHLTQLHLYNIKQYYPLVHSSKMWDFSIHLVNDLNEIQLNGKNNRDMCF